MKELLPYIINTITAAKVRHEVHSFESGAMMVDIWVNNDFYVIQIDGNRVGLSLINDNTAFDTIPDHSFSDINSFKKVFENIFCNSDNLKYEQE